VTAQVKVTADDLKRRRNRWACRNHHQRVGKSQTGNLSGRISFRSGAKKEKTNQRWEKGGTLRKHQKNLKVKFLTRTQENGACSGVTRGGGEFVVPTPSYRGEVCVRKEIIIVPRGPQRGGTLGLGRLSARKRHEEPKLKKGTNRSNLSPNQ